MQITILDGAEAKILTSSPIMVTVGKYCFGCKTNEDVLTIVKGLLEKPSNKDMLLAEPPNKEIADVCTCGSKKAERDRKGWFVCPDCRKPIAHNAEL